MAELRLNNITKVYKPNIEAVKSVKLHIRDGEALAIVGPSGCGKSTLLRVIAGLETQSQGEILLDNRDIGRDSPKDRNMAMVFQQFALYETMTVFENIAFPLKMQKISKAEISRRVGETMDMLGISKLAGRKSRSLSGGEKQRVAIGRALVRRPEVFLMDEPLSNLDAKLRLQLKTEIAQLQKHLGITMLYVTHDQSEAMCIGDRIAVMRDGEIVQCDTPEIVYENPKNLFTANFFGNLPVNQFVQNHQSLAIRPEYVAMSRTRKTDQSNLWIDAEFLRKDFLGSVYVYNFSTEMESITVQTMEDWNLAAGEKVWLHLRQDKLMRFDDSN